MTKYPLLMDTEAFDHKPAGQEIAAINQRIANHHVTLSMQEIADAVASGHTVVLADIDGQRKKENLKEQHLVALDFDNTITKNGVKTKTEGSQYTSVEDILNDQWIKKNAAFLYATFSWQDDWQHFRVLFALDRPLTNNNQVKACYEWLLKKYPTADKSTVDSSRLFFGGTEQVEIGYDNVLNTSQIKVTKPKSATKYKTHASASAPKKVTNEQAKEAFTTYLDKEKESLLDYDKALSVIWVLAKAAKTKEISPIIAKELVKDLAMGNDKWEEENTEKFREAMNTSLDDFHTVYSFREKIMGQHFELNDDKIDATDMIKTSKVLVNKMDIKVYNHAVYFRQGNHWMNDTNKMYREITNYVDLKSAQDHELYQQFMKRGELMEANDSVFYNVQFRNGYYLHGDRIIEGQSEFTPYYLDVDYNPNAYNADVDNFLNTIINGRTDVRPIIEEMFGHILMVNKFPHKVFFLVGSKGANGKSTLLEMLNHWLGDYASNISLENFDDPTSVVALEGKMANIGDDIEVKYLDSSSNFKILASGNTITVRPIYSEPYTMRNKATLIFSANGMPSFRDKSGGIARRIVLIPLDANITKPDFNIDEKLATDNAKSYILNLALNGLHRIVENGTQLSYSQTIEANVTNYLVDNNSVLSFVEDMGIDENESQQVVYQEYVNYCKLNGFKHVKKNSFTRELDGQGYESKKKIPFAGAKQIRVYAKKV